MSLPRPHTTDGRLLRELAEWIERRPQTLGLGSAGTPSSRDVRDDLRRIADRLDTSGEDERWAARVNDLEARIRVAERALRGEP